MALAAFGAACVIVAQSPNAASHQLWRHRNLGKALYENPTTQTQAVDEFQKALGLAPESVRERINYGLALLRAGETARGIEELQKAQEADPKIPHTWFNLGIAFKKQGDTAAALAQFRQMAQLVPGEPVTRYQIGSILKAEGDAAGAVREFEAAREMNPQLAAPHFQLYGLYRQLKRAEESAAELRIFQKLKEQQEGAAVPEDMEWSFYSEIYDPIDMPQPAPPPPPMYRNERVAGGFASGTPGLTALLLDATGRVGVVAWSNERVALFRNGRVPVPASGLETLRDVAFVAAGDFDNDGLSDLCVVGSAAAELYRNVGGRFRKHADLAAGVFRQVLWVDYDHDYDLDVVLLGAKPRLMRNNGGAGFSDESARFPFVAGMAVSGVRFDLEPDTPGFDLAVANEDRTGVLYRDRLGGTYEATPLNALPAGATNLSSGDFNHDGRTDLLAIPGLRLINTPAGWRAEQVKETRAVPVSRRERARLAADGTLFLDRDIAANYGSWIEVSLTGVKNLKTAVGAKVEIRAGALYAKATYEGLPLVFRLGDRKQVDTIRVTWANGLIQNEPNRLVNKVAAIREAPRLSGSCPMIFTWNGDRYVFITDVLGVAPLGASSGNGNYFPVDHDEAVLIPGELLRQRNGTYDIRVTEELREISYLDQIQLQRLDHPAEVEIVTNEKFKSPPFPEFRLFGGTRRLYPVAARDGNGRDVLSEVQRRDSTYPDAFRRNAAGVAELHYLDLDFGGVAASNRAALIMQGWVDWADGSTFLGAMQEGSDLKFPYLQVKDAAGQWRTVIDDMGIPSGKPKPIAIDLAGKFLSKSREVRIATNLCVYWDEIYLIEDGAPPPARLAAVPLISADLQFRGFSRVTVHPERKQPEHFDYERVSVTSMWNPTPGNYTRFGPVPGLLHERDDRLVVMGSGDELSLRFDARGLPDLPSGWKRDFLLVVDGWAKDGDANTAFSQSVLPLPFHNMTSYPYPAGERYPDGPVHRAYQQEYNTRPALRLIRPLRRGAGD